jgi:hypothetical protein
MITQIYPLCRLIYPKFVIWVIWDMGGVRDRLRGIYGFLAAADSDSPIVSVDGSTNTCVITVE